MGTQVGSIEVRLQAVLQDFKAQFESAAKSVDKFARGADASLKGLGASAVSASKGIQSINLELTAIGVTAGLVLRDVVATFADFEQSMARLRAVTRATDEEFAQMTETARELGKTTVFSATDAANAMVFLGKSGKDVNTVIAASDDVLNLAAASMLGMAESADILVKIMGGFQLQAQDLTNVVDVLALAGTTANTDLVQLGEAFKFLGPGAASLGVSFNETTAALQILANAGLEGSIAGTTLRNVFAKLEGGTPAVSKKLDAMGISAKDAAGNTRPLADILDELNEKGIRGAKAMELFGVRGGPGLNILLASGGDGLRLYIELLNKAAGTAARIAEIQRGTLQGTFERLKSAIQEVGISLGQILLPALNSLTQFLIVATDKFNDAPPALKNIAAAVLVLATIIPALLVGLAAVVIGLNKINVAATNAAVKMGLFSETSVAAGATAARSFGKFLIIVAVIAAVNEALGFFTDKATEAAKKSGDVSNVWIRGFIALGAGVSMIRSVLTLNFSKIGAGLAILVGAFAEGISNMGLLVAEWAKGHINNFKKVLSATASFARGLGFDEVARRIDQGANIMGAAMSRITAFQGDLIKNSRDVSAAIAINAAELVGLSGEPVNAVEALAASQMDLREIMKQIDAHAAEMALKLQEDSEQMNALGEETEEAGKKARKAADDLKALDGAVEDLGNQLQDLNRTADLSGAASRAGQSIQGLVSARRSATETLTKARDNAVEIGASGTPAQRAQAATQLANATRLAGEIEVAAIRNAANGIRSATDDRISEIGVETDRALEEVRRQGEELTALRLQNVGDEFGAASAQIESGARQMAQTRTAAFEEEKRKINEEIAGFEALISAERAKPEDKRDASVIAELQASIEREQAAVISRQEALTAELVAIESDRQEKIAQAQAVAQQKQIREERDRRLAAIDRLAAETEARLSQRAAGEADPVRKAGIEVERADAVRRFADERVGAENRAAEAAATAASMIQNGDARLTEFRRDAAVRVLQARTNTEQAIVRVVQASSERLQTIRQEEIREERKRAAEFERENSVTRQQQQGRFEVREATTFTDTAKERLRTENLVSNRSRAGEDVSRATNRVRELERRSQSASAQERLIIEQELEAARDQLRTARVAQEDAASAILVDIEERRKQKTLEIYGDQFLQVKDGTIKFRFDMEEILTNMANQQLKVIADVGNEWLLSFFKARDSANEAAAGSAQAWDQAATTIEGRGQGLGGALQGIFGVLGKSVGSIFGEIGGSFGGLIQGITGGGGLGAILGAIGGPLGLITAAIPLVSSLFSKKKGGEGSSASNAINSLTSAAAAPIFERAAESASRAVESPSGLREGAAQVVQSISIVNNIEVNATGLDAVAERLAEGIPGTVKKTVDELRRLDRLAERGLPRRAA